MPIILTDQEQSLKHALLKESLREQLKFKICKNTSFPSNNHPNYHTKYTPRSGENEISDWNHNSDLNDGGKVKVERFMLPQMKNARKSRNIEELSRELLKYEQFDGEGGEEESQHKFRLSFLGQMTKVNFKKDPTRVKKQESPKKIDIKLQFPQRYERYQNDNQPTTNPSPPLPPNTNRTPQQLSGSFYSKSLTRGLIPSIKKLSSFPKRAMFRSQSERDPYQNNKFKMKKEEWQSARNSVAEEIGGKFMGKELSQRQRRVKLARLEKRLPINFLSYSHRRQNSVEKGEEDDGENEEENHKAKDCTKKTRKSPYLKHLPTSSYYPKPQKMTDEELLYEHKRLAECLLLNISKKRYDYK